VGVTPRGLELLTAGTTLQVERVYPGNWKEQPGVYFQDVVLLRKHTA
jgi:hypothetical protein